MREPRDQAGLYYRVGRVPDPWLTGVRRWLRLDLSGLARHRRTRFALQPET